MIKLYTSPTCGKCRIIKIKLEAKKIAFEISEDFEEMSKLSIMNLPVLKLEDGTLIRDMNEINKYVEAVTNKSEPAVKEMTMSRVCFG